MGRQLQSATHPTNEFLNILNLPLFQWSLSNYCFWLWNFFLSRPNVVNTCSFSLQRPNNPTWKFWICCLICAWHNKHMYPYSFRLIHVTFAVYYSNILWPTVLGRITRGQKDASCKRQRRSILIMPVRENSLRTEHGHHKMCHCVKLTNMDIDGYRVFRYIFGVQGFSSVNVSLAELSMMGFVHHMFSLELSPKHYSDIISVFT